MKDSRFIELVNLYVDRHITADEAAELEAEIQSSPARRAIYRQYCQMQRATTQVYESFRTNSAPGQPAADNPGQAAITRFENREPRRRGNWIYYAGGLAAACLAVAVIRINFNHPEDVTVAGIGPRISPPAAVAAVPPLVTSAPVEPRAGLVSLRNNAASDQDYAAMVAALRQEEQRAFAAAQAQAGRLPSLFEDGVFDTQQGFTTGNQRTFRSRQAPASQAEFTAFQFQR